MAVDLYTKSRALAQLVSGCVLGVSWVCPGCVLGVSWVCPGCVPGLPSVYLDAETCALHGHDVSLVLSLNVIMIIWH